MEAGFYKDLNVSYFRNTRSTSPETNELTLGQFLSHERRGIDKLITELRKLSKGSDEFKRFKMNNMPCATLSCVVDGERNMGHVIKRNPVIVLDIDTDPEHPEINSFMADDMQKELMKHFFFNLPYVLAVGDSCSGKGLFIVVTLETNNDNDEFLRYFQALEEEFAEMGVVLDKSCKDITRLRYISNATDMVKDGDIIPFNKMKEPYMHAEKPKRRFRGRNSGISDDMLLYAVMEALIDDGYVPEGGSNTHDPWMHMIRYCKAFGPQGLEWADEISRNDTAKYSGFDAVEYKWNHNPAYDEEDAKLHFFSIAKKRFKDGWRDYCISRLRLDNNTDTDECQLTGLAKTEAELLSHVN
jgi:hypothetical protein